MEKDKLLIMIFSYLTAIILGLGINQYKNIVRPEALNQEEKKLAEKNPAFLKCVKNVNSPEEGTYIENFNMEFLGSKMKAMSKNRVYTFTDIDSYDQFMAEKAPIIISEFENSRLENVTKTGDSSALNFTIFGANRQEQEISLDQMGETATATGYNCNKE